MVAWRIGLVQAIALVVRTAHFHPIVCHVVLLEPVGGMELPEPAPMLTARGSSSGRSGGSSIIATDTSCGRTTPRAPDHRCRNEEAVSDHDEHPSCNGVS